MTGLAAQAESARSPRSPEEVPIGRQIMFALGVLAGRSMNLPPFGLQLRFARNALWRKT